MWRPSPIGYLHSLEVSVTFIAVVFKSELPTVSGVLRYLVLTKAFFISKLPTFEPLETIMIPYTTAALSQGVDGLQRAEMYRCTPRKEGT